MTDVKDSDHVNLIQQERETAVRQHIPELFSGKYHSVLYVGANQKRQHFLNNFQESKYNKIVVIEAFHENAMYLKDKLEKNSDLFKIIEGDIRDIEKFDLSKFDVVFFWHGIEHLPLQDIEPTLENLESYANFLVVLGMPFGDYPQGEEYGNIYEKHLTALYPSMLEKCGYTTHTIGNVDEIGSNLTAWKHI